MMQMQKDKYSGRSLIVVRIEDHPKVMVLLRAARNRALSMNGRWAALFVETRAQVGLADDGMQERMLRLLTLAEQMGGTPIHVEAETTDKGIDTFLEEQKDKIALFIIGSVAAKGWFKKIRKASWQHIADKVRKKQIAVEVIALSGPNYRRSFHERLRWFRLSHILYALLAVGVAHICALSLEWSLPPALFRINEQNVGLLFMIACAFAAGRFGMLPGVVASVGSAFIENYYFTLPYHTLKFDSVTDILNATLFLGAAILISLFTSQTHGYAEKAAKRELSTQALFTLYRTASVSSSRQQALERLQNKLTRMLKMDVAFFLPAVLNPMQIAPAYPADMQLEEADRTALELCWKESKTTGIASPFNPGTAWRFESMIAATGEIGVLGVRPRNKARLDAWFGRLLAAIADQTATVIEHIELERSMEATRISEEREKLRSMLLSSVSHDLKTPLVSIIGALSIHRNPEMQLSVAKKEMLIDTALEETQRLNSFITNILDMTRLESGKIEFRQDWHDPKILVQDVLGRLGFRSRQHTVNLTASAQNIEIYIDLVMTEQVLQNILDNAFKYTPEGTAIDVHYETNDNGEFILEVHDHGAGLPADKIDRVFDKYARLHKKDSQVAGTGLGLAIGKAIIEAQGGVISASNHSEGGAVFTICLPQWRETQVVKYSA